MAFADAFSAENVGKLMSDPRLMLGLSMMAQGRQGSGAQALGQAGLPAMQMLQQQQHSQQLQQYREQIAAQGQQAMAFRQQQAQAKQDAAQRQQQAFADPNLQAQLGPMARYLAQAGIDPDMILKANSGDALQAHRAAQLQQQANQFSQTQARLAAGGGGGNGGDRGPKAGTPRQILHEQLGDGKIQDHLLDPATGSYRPYGKVYSAWAPGKSGAVEETVDQLTPDVGAGPAVPGLPGAAPSSSYTKQPVQGAELLMHSSGANPMARPPSNSIADGVLSGITPPDARAVADGILASATPKYATPPKVSAPAAPTGALAAAKAAIGRGAPRAAVVARLTQAGFTAAQIAAAGL